MTIRILVVEDEPAVRRMLIYNLRASGYETVAAADAEEALTLIEEVPPDLLILDWMLPGLSGLELCRRIRSRRRTARIPVVMLTARVEENDRLRGLDTGADDYVTKPFSPAELMARIRAVLRRAREGGAGDTLSFTDLRMDPAAHRVQRRGRRIHLSPIEFRLLRHFLENPRRVFDRSQLLDRIWGLDADVELRTVDATIRRLRRALNAQGEPDLIRTVRGFGYALELPEATHDRSSRKARPADGSPGDERRRLQASAALGEEGDPAGDPPPERERPA